MGDPYKGKLAGHAMMYGRIAAQVYPNRMGEPYKARCECGAESPTLARIADRVAWHQEHKADVLDTWVANGCDDRGREVHL